MSRANLAFLWVGCLGGHAYASGIMALQTALINQIIEFDCFIWIAHVPILIS